MKLSNRLALFSFLSVLLVGLFFQNCSENVLFKDQPDSNRKLESENGGPYGGKPGEYRFYDPTNPCRTRDLAGQPLPNEMILFLMSAQGSMDPYLTRKSCEDVTPLALSSTEVQVDHVSRTLSYQGQSFTAQRPGDFDIVAGSCPAGKSMIPGSVRSNQFAFPFDWTNLQTLRTNVWSPGWYNFPGINVSLHSTLSSLPAFMIARNESTQLENWRRSSQHLYLQSSTEYSFTFFASPGSVSAADFTFYRGWTGVAGDPRNEEAIITFDFQSRSTRNVRITNVANVSSTITPFENGFICTVYFSTSSNGDQTESNIGVAPSTAGQMNGQVGDSIIATAAQLVPVNQFCR